MDSFARQDASDRAAVFGESGALRGVASIIIEKDFLGLLDLEASL